MSDFSKDELWDALMRAHSVFITDFEKLMASNFASFRKEMNGHYAEVNRRLESLIELVVDTRKVAERAARSKPSS